MNLIEKRRSIRLIDNSIIISDDELINEIKSILKHTPSSYNAQSQRIMVLLNDNHKEFWKLVLEELRKIVPENNFLRTETKINGFMAGYGTVLFFDEEAITNDLTEKFPLYKQNFINWAREQSGMLQINVWNQLAKHNIGASLQHYNEVIEESAKALLSIPASWKMIAQMPFGNSLEEPGQKKFVDVEERIIIKK